MPGYPSTETSYSSISMVKNIMTVCVHIKATTLHAGTVYIIVVYLETFFKQGNMHSWTMSAAAKH